MLIAADLLTVCKQRMLKCFSVVAYVKIMYVLDADWLEPLSSTMRLAVAVPFVVQRFRTYGIVHFPARFSFRRISLPCLRIGALHRCRVFCDFCVCHSMSFMVHAFVWLLHREHAASPSVCIVAFRFLRMHFMLNAFVCIRCWLQQKHATSSNVIIVALQCSEVSVSAIRVYFFISALICRESRYHAYALQEKYASKPNAIITALQSFQVHVGVIYCIICRTVQGSFSPFVRCAIVSAFQV